MTDDTDKTYKDIIREKGLCGEVFVDEHGVKVACVASFEDHHDEVVKLRARVAKLEHVATVARAIEQNMIARKTFSDLELFSRLSYAIYDLDKEATK